MKPEYHPEKLQKRYNLSFRRQNTMTISKCNIGFMLTETLNLRQNIEDVNPEKDGFFSNRSVLDFMKMNPKMWSLLINEHPIRFF